MNDRVIPQRPADLDRRDLLADSGIRSEGSIALARYLQIQIARGHLLEGHRLPTERDLSDRFGASRGAVRRVLSHLKSLGLITQVVGSGTFVAQGAAELLSPTSEPVSSSPIFMSDQVSPAQLMDARLLIEPQMASLIVRFATAVDFESMENCLRRGEESTDIEEFEHWDGALHQALAEATHNKFFLRILELTNEVREQGEWGRLKRVSLTSERRERYEAQHCLIVAALRDRDEAMARDLLRDHLLEVKHNLFSG